MKELSPEAYRIVLFFLGQRRENTLFAEELAALSKDAWLSALAAAKKEQLIYPFLSSVFSYDDERPILTEEVRFLCRETMQGALVQSALFGAQAAQALELLDSLGIKLLLFKGPAVDHLLYGKGLLRPRADLDFVVEGCVDWTFLAERLQVWGYCQEDRGDYDIPEYTEGRIFSKQGAEAVPLHAHRHILNNLFLAVGDAGRVPMERVWQEARPFENYANIFSLRPEASVIFLGEHALKHDFSPLILLYEIDGLILRCGRTWEWERFVSLTGEFGLTRAVFCALMLAREFFSTPVPPDSMAVLRPKSWTRLEEIFFDKVRRHEPRTFFCYAVYLALQEGWVRKIRYFFRTIFPPRMSPRAWLLRLARGARLLLPKTY